MKKTLLFLFVLPCVCWAQQVPVICYHDISPKPLNEMMTTPSNFDLHMQYLHDKGYHTLSMDQLVEFMRGHRPIPAHSIVITFDDGYEGVYRYAFPKLRKYGFDATLFVVTSAIGSKRGPMQHLTWPQIREMDASGVVDCEVHAGSLHLKMVPLYSHYPAAVLTDLSAAKHSIETHLHKHAKYLAWPYGNYNSSLIHAALSLGFRGLVTTDYGLNGRGGDPLRIKRIRMSTRFDNLSAFKRKLAHYGIH